MAASVTYESDERSASQSFSASFRNARLSGDDCKSIEL